MASFSSEIPLAAANCSIDVMFDLDEALDLTTYLPTGNVVGDEETAESPKLKSDPKPLLVSKLPVVAAGSGGVAVSCSVCMESFAPAGNTSEGFQIPCGHVYHAACIATWVSMYDSCPLCRCKVSSS